MLFSTACDSESKNRRAAVTINVFDEQQANTEQWTVSQRSSMLPAPAVHTVTLAKTKTVTVTASLPGQVGFRLTAGKACY